MATNCVSLLRIQCDTLEPQMAAPAAVKPWKLWFDGGARGNPGRAGAGWIIRSSADTIVAAGWTYIGDKETNNTAEYTALNEGMRVAMEIDVKRAQGVKAFGDSTLVVMQVTGEWKIKKPHLARLCETSRKLVTKLGAKLAFVPREENKEADLLSNVVSFARSANSPQKLTV